MKVLFIGGTGIISSACSQRAVDLGIDLYHLNRGKKASIRAIDGIKTLIADINDIEAVRSVLANHYFDAVVQWIGFEPEQIERDIALFEGKTDHYIFISSASVYETPPRSWPVTEETPAINPIWKYSQNKIACENLLKREYEAKQFPYTIVRPSHTYDRTYIPLEGEYTVINRMKQGKDLIVHGEGTSLWTLTNHRDFAKGLVGLLGKKETIGETYHITSDEWLSWDQIVLTLADAFGLEPQIVHIPSEIIAKYDSDIGDSLLGDKAHSMVFDNSKIKAAVPEFEAKISFSEGAKEIAAWFNEDPARQIVNNELDAIFDTILEYWNTVTRTR